MPDTWPRIEVVSEFKPAGDQPGAIDSLVEGIEAGLAHQTLLGVTGSGKTSIANVIRGYGGQRSSWRPTKRLPRNYGEFKNFPNNSVEYCFYYDITSQSLCSGLRYLHKKTRR